MESSTGYSSVEEQFAQRVKTERETRGMSQADLANELVKRGIRSHGSTIGKIESRDTLHPRTVRLDEAAALAAIFETTLDDLIGNNHGYDPQVALDRVSRTALHTRDTIDTAVDQLRKSLTALKLAPLQADPPIEPDCSDPFFRRAALMQSVQPRLHAAISTLSVVLREFGDYAAFDEDILNERFIALAAQIQGEITPLTDINGNDNHKWSRGECICGWAGSKRFHQGHRDWVAEQRAIADSV